MCQSDQPIFPSAEVAYNVFSSLLMPVPPGPSDKAHVTAVLIGVVVSVVGGVGVGFGLLIWRKQKTTKGIVPIDKSDVSPWAPPVDQSIMWSQNVMFVHSITEKSSPEIGLPKIAGSSD